MGPRDGHMLLLDKPAAAVFGTAQLSTVEPVETGIVDYRVNGDLSPIYSRRHGSGEKIFQ